VRIATVLWPCTPELIVALDEHLGPPVDSYVNGSQTWFTGEPVLEWRLHPAAGFAQPGTLSPYDLWDEVVGAISSGTDPAALALGGTTVALAALWDGLECFPAYGDDLEPMAVVQRAGAELPIAPERHGLVDHDAVGDEWERANGTASIVDLLRAQLSG